MAIKCECGKLVKNERMMNIHRQTCANVKSIYQVRSEKIRDSKARKKRDFEMKSQLLN